MEVPAVSVSAASPPIKPDVDQALDNQKPHRGWSLADVLTTREVSRRVPALALGAVAGMSLLLRLWPVDQPAVDALRLLLATICIGVAPGALALLMVAAFPRLGMLEWLGLSIALSLSAGELLTFVSLGLHLPAVAIALGLAAAEMVVGLVMWLRPPRLSINVAPADGVVGLLLVIIAVLLYVKGSGFLDFENETHISVIRRLAEVPRPAIDNIYIVPHFVYTYPFPGTHFLLALISRLGALDPLLVYDKMRSFWSPAALLFVYLFVRVSLGRAGIALAAVCTASVLVLNGTFADVYGFFWGQLAPFSHAGDVAMGVLLPGLLVLAVYFLEVPSFCGRAFFFVASLLLALMITIVHIREIVQFIVYLGSLFGIVLLMRRNRRELGQIGLLVASTLAIAVVYAMWQRHNVPTADTIVQLRRQQLVELAQSMPIDGFFSPRLTDNRFDTEFEATFYGGFPLLLLWIPLLPIFFPRRLGVLLMTASTAVYVAIIRFPFLTIPYIYGAYYEIMFTPVRNMVFFAYCSAGILLYVLGVSLARMRSWTMMLSASVALGAALAVVWAKLGELLWHRVGDVVTDHSDFLLYAILLETIAVFILLGIKGTAKWRDSLMPAAVNARWPVPFLTLLVTMALGTQVQASSPVNLNITDSHLTDHSVRNWVGCFSREELRYPAPYRGCFPDEQLVQWGKDHLTTSDVVLTDRNNVSLFTMLMAQQVLSWPGDPSEFPRNNFPAFYAWYDRTQEQYGVDPFFNTVETLPEREHFLRDMAPNYVALDPGNYADMKPVLAQWPNAFTSVFDDGNWALYKIQPLVGASS